jgi:putative zinc finger/helix-turn-helix YgiT family protein
MAMDRCTECGKKGLEAGEQPITREVGERIFEGLVEGWRCRACGEVFYEGSDLEHFEQLAAAWLAEHGVRTPEELKFMRKAVGIRASDLAALLDVTPETVSHWETGKHVAELAVRSEIAAIVLETLRRPTTAVERLRAQGKPAPAGKVRLTKAA